MKRLPLLLAMFAAFQLFNYPLTDLLGDLAVLGVRWATILAIAFCAIDIIPLSSLFAERDEMSWFLFGAWVLAAAMNATLTWRGFWIALAENSAGNTVPVIAAVMTWVIRSLIAGTLSLEASSSRIAHIAEAHHERSISRRRFSGGSLSA